ncbi:MAG: type II toxin-antitoxin system RelE/ParE family toxin [Brevundimonas sp.]
MRYRVRLLPPARSDLIRVSNFLADVAPSAALRAADVLDEALRTLERFPERAPRNNLGGRDMVVRFGRFGYVIRYRVERADVVVARIYHSLEDRSF